MPRGEEGRHEQDPNIWWREVVAALAAAVSELGGRAAGRGPQRLDVCTRRRG
jgi:hypothetical protein